jgi:hypothetical protein
MVAGRHADEGSEVKAEEMTNIYKNSVKKSKKGQSLDNE